MPLLRWSGRLAATLAAFTSLLTPCGAATPIPQEARIAPDPAVKRGTLANGLRYAVMQNGSPAKMISVRLAVEVGSYAEEESESGFAHFVEHMAFRPTKADPNGAFDNRFASLGVALGRDQNAGTGLDATIYRIDLPSRDLAALKMVLEWMRGAADGMIFSQAAVDTERGVVQAERRAAESPLATVQRETSLFQGLGLRGFDRNPGGTEASLGAATPAALRAFYERWYRPENALVVVAGDAPIVELEAAVTTAFESWAPVGVPGQRPAPGIIPARGLDAMVKSAPSLPSAVSACRLSPPPTNRSATLHRMRQDQLSDLWTGILTKRISQIANKDDTSLLGGLAMANRDLPDASAACLIIVPNKGRQMEALAVAQAELRRFAASGPTQLEINIAAEEQRSRLRAAVSQASTRNSIAVADAIVEAELSDRIFQSPADAMRSFDIAADGISPEDVVATIRADWSGSGPLLAAVGERPPTREELLAAWNANEAAHPLDAYADRTLAVWAYESFGKRGKVKRAKRFSDPDYSRFTFANGVVLTFKQTSFRAKGTEVRVRFGHGERMLDPESRWLASLASEVFPSAGLGRMDYEDIASALSNTSWTFSLGISPDAYTLNASPMSEQVPQELKLLAAYMTDPGFRPAIDAKLPTVIDIFQSQRRTTPITVAMEALEEALYPGRTSMPPRERMTAYRVKDFEQLLRPELTQSPIEVTIVGDIGEKESIQAVADTFGALPKRRPLAPPKGAGPFRRFPATLPAPLTARHEGPSEKAAAVLIWPLYVATPERRSEEYAILLLGEILETRLLRSVRFEMGKAYSPAVGAITPDASDEGFLAATLEATPADIGQLVAAARAIAGDLAAGRISQEELDAARTPLIAARLQAQGTNESWAGILALSYRHPSAMDELLAFDAMLNALTLEDLRRAAARWLVREPAVSTALPAS